MTGGGWGITGGKCPGMKYINIGRISWNLKCIFSNGVASICAFNNITLC